jgi:hypothetical protein
MKKNKFFILITTFNRPSKIRRHLENFNNKHWSQLKNCKPIIIIADDYPGGKLKNLCRIYKKKIKYFNLVYLQRKKTLGQGINFFDVVKKNISNGYIWPVGDDDFLLPRQSVDFINKIIKFTPDVAVCEFRQGKKNSSGTFFKGKSRMIFDVAKGLEFIQRFGKCTSIVFKRPSNKLIFKAERMFLGCMYEDRPLTVISFLCSQKPSLYLKTELTATADKDFGTLKYSMRVFVNLENAMNLAIDYCSKHKQIDYPLLKIDHQYDEYRWWKIGIYKTLKYSEPRYTKLRFLKEVFIFPLVIFRKFFQSKDNFTQKWIK